MELNKEEKKKPEALSTVAYYQIFRYGTNLEKCATLLGAFFGLLSGAGSCYNLVQFGELTTAFVERTSNSTRPSSYLPLTSFFGGGRILVNASAEENKAALVEDALAMCKGMAVVIVLSIIFCMTSVALINWSALNQITRIRKLFLKAVLSQDMEWFDTDTEFNLASKMSENMTKLRDGMGDKIVIVTNLIGTAIICICQAFPLGWELTLACITVVPLSVTGSVLLFNYQAKSSVHEMKSYSKAGKHAEEVLKSIKTIVAFAGESKEVEQYQSLLQPAERYGRKRGFYTGLGTGFNWVLTYAINSIGLAYGTRLVLNDLEKPVEEQQYVVGQIFTIMFSIYMATQCITMYVPNAEAFAAARGAAAGIFSIIDRYPKIDSLGTSGISLQRLIGEISLENVTFSYPSRPDVKVLKGFSIHVKPGENVALVGSSGCGKSTILQLIQRLYDPHSGVVKVDNKDIRTLNVGYLRSSLGVVGQEPVLFRGTIHDNISIGSPDATRADVEKAAVMAYAHDFISKLPNGYETVIGERGASLSGGQKQRIAIARSLLREPAVLLLDEATSALDPHSERQVQAALDNASKGRTTLTVSHRLSTIVNADRIVCMDQGKIVEQGTHAELMKAKGFFYKLVSAGQSQSDVLETIPDAKDGTGAPRNPVSSSIPKITRQISSRKDSLVTPRGSICSVISTGLQNFAMQHDNKTDENVANEPVRAVSDFDLLKINAPEWPLITTGAIAAVIQGACFPALSIVLGYTTSIFVFPDHAFITYTADLYSGLFMIIAAVAGISMFLQSLTFTSAGLKMTTRLREQYFSSLLRQEIGYFDRESNTVGALCARLSGDAAAVQGATGLRIGLILQGISSVIIGFILALFYIWKLALVGLAFLPLLIGSIWLETMVSQKSSSDERNALESATAIATEAVVSIRTVQSLGIENNFLNKFEDTLKDSCRAIAQKTRWRGLVLGLGLYVPLISFCSCTVYGAILVARDDVPYYHVFLVNQAIMYGSYMLAHSLVGSPGFQAARDCGARILSLIYRSPEVITEKDAKDSPDWSATGNFSLQNIQFSYPTRPRQKILRGIDLKVEAGKTVALVGSSGCGKSTILQLLQRFYDPDSGTIELDGHDIRQSLTIPRLRRQLGVVQQEPVLFDRSLAENIAYGDNTRQVSMEEIVAAAKAANIHSFIISLPQGYDTNLGASGAQLSGGQKQRVCIARALIRAPRLLLLDEATSALDANSERTVTEALEKAAKGRTCITIAHRLSTIKDSDLICVLDKGKIVEKGTHAELINLQGFYWRMSKGQQLA